MQAWQISALAAACERGGDRSVVCPEEPDWFDRILAAQLAGRISAKRLGWLNDLRRKSHGALLAAREGHLADAIRSLAAAERQISAAAPGIAREVGLSLFHAESAFVLYRQGALERAVQQLQAAFLCDAMLVKDAQFSVFGLHRVQLLHNMMRLERSRQRISVAIAFGCAALAVLERPDSPLPRGLPSPWNLDWPEGRSDLPEACLRQMHGQIARDCVRAQTQLHLLSSAVTTTAQERSTQIARWARVKLALSHQRIDEAYDDAIELLQTGPLPSLPLWRDGAEGIRDCLAHHERSGVAESC